MISKKIILNKIKVKKANLNDTESVLLLFDSLTCPYISYDIKKKIVGLSVMCEMKIHKKK